MTEHKPRPLIAYRPDIDGLRAVSILAVVLYHAFPSSFPGGFVGVDVFFVISGYLITSLLLAEWNATGRVSLLQFWARRTRRILPIATFVIICIALVAMLFPILDGRQIGRQIIASALFYQNIRLADRSTDYLADDHSNNPLLHYWSLSVEEQFYVLWPPLLILGLLATGRFLRGRAMLSIGIAALSIAVCSFAYSVHASETSPAWAFFGAPSRAWQLLVGAAVAIALHERPVVREAYSGFLVVAGLTGIFASVAALSGETAYPGLAAIAPTLSAALLLYAARGPSTLSRFFLESAPLRLIGRVSYSWYLWHWPALIFGVIALSDTPSVRVGMLIFSFALAVLSFKYIETPFRRGLWLNGRTLRTYATGVMLVISGATTGALMRHFAPDAIHLGDGVYVSAGAIRSDKPAIYNDGCLLRFPEIQSPPCVYGNSNAENSVLLFGDSYAGNWFDALYLAALQYDFQLIVRIKASCSPVDVQQTVDEGAGIRPYRECNTWRQNTLSEVESLEPNAIFVSSSPVAPSSEAELTFLDRLASATESLVVVRSSPTLPEDPLSCLRLAQAPNLCQWALSGNESRYPMTAVEDLPANALVLDLADTVCPVQTCSAVQNGTVVMFDNLHFTASFARALAPIFLEAIEGLDKF